MNTQRDDLHELAGEYVLGTLSAERRREVEQSLPHDAALRQAVQQWEEHLLPLTAQVDPVTPPPELWGRIAAGLPQRATTAPKAFVNDTRGHAGGWWNSLKLWRSLAAGGFAAASLMAVLVGTRLHAPPVAAPSQFLVVLAAPQDMAPGWVVQASDDGQLRLVPLVSTAVPAQNALQFWTKGDDWKAPVSLGLVKPGEPLELQLDKLPPLEANQLFEITLEPQQGSPTGLPTGPILYIGRAVKMI